MAEKFTYLNFEIREVNFYSIVKNTASPDYVPLFIEKYK